MHLIFFSFSFHFIFRFQIFLGCLEFHFNDFIYEAHTDMCRYLYDNDGHKKLIPLNAVYSL